MASVAVAGGAVGLFACADAPPDRDAMGFSPVGNVDTLADRGPVDRLLDGWHRAASNGDFYAYFSRMTGDAVFLGTDESERWRREEFEAFARPYFDGTEAWTYVPVSRHIVLGPGDDARIAWFDEVLDNEKYGRCRGTGVVLRDDDGRWRIAHYSLSFLVPNRAAADVAELIRGAGEP